MELYEDESAQGLNSFNCDKNEEHIYSTYISYKMGILKHPFYCFKIDTIQKNLSQQYIDKGMIIRPEYVD